jgi:hypothetical protein
MSIWVETVIHIAFTHVKTGVWLERPRRLLPLDLFEDANGAN